MTDNEYIEKINRYIEGVKFPAETHYQMNAGELFALCHVAREVGTAGMIALAFDYGRAKGYRTAKAGRKKARS